MEEYNDWFSSVITDSFVVQCTWFTMVYILCFVGKLSETAFNFVLWKKNYNRCVLTIQPTA